MCWRSHWYSAVICPHWVRGTLFCVGDFFFLRDKCLKSRISIFSFKQFWCENNKSLFILLKWELKYPTSGINTFAQVMYIVSVLHPPLPQRGVTSGTDIRCNTTRMFQRSKQLSIPRVWPATCGTKPVWLVNIQVRIIIVRIEQSWLPQVPSRKTWTWIIAFGMSKTLISPSRRVSSGERTGSPWWCYWVVSICHCCTGFFFLLISQCCEENAL